MESQALSMPISQGRPVPRLLLFLFLLSLVLLNPWVRGDGVGYYAFARAPLIEHSLNFEHDYIAANTGFREARLDERGQPRQIFRTHTGHLDNHFTVGPAMLWAPFLLLAHGGVLLARALGSQVAADGFSGPYHLAMAFGTAFWAFLGLLLVFRLARQYAGDLWALLATLAIWWASSLPVYMYFNPSWSHAHSAFAVSLFVFYWHQTRERRSVRQWFVLALIAGLMLNVYYANAMLLMILVVEAQRDYTAVFRRGAGTGAAVLQRRCKTGRGVRPISSPSFFPPNTVCFPGPRCFCWPPRGLFYSSGASRAWARRCWPARWRFIFLSRAIRTGPASLLSGIDFSFRLHRYLFLA